MLKVAFLQPGYAHYRDEFFDILSKRFRLSVIHDNPGNPDFSIPEAARAKGQREIPFRPRSLGLLCALMRERPDVVVSNVSSSVRSVVAFLYAKLLRKRVILWIEEWREPVYHGFSLRNVAGSIRKLTGRKMLVKSHALVAGGTMAYQYCIARRGTPEGIFFAMQCARDQKKHYTQEPPSRNGRSAGRTFLYLGRLVKLKGLDLLIKAFARLRESRNDVHLLVAGDGPFKAECLDLRRSLDLRGIEFLGKVKPSETPMIYGQADIFVMPSRLLGNAYEGFGLVINEAASMGLPVIASDAAGAAFDMVIPGYNGLIVPQGDPDALYLAMKRIVELDFECMGLNSRKVFNLKNNYSRMAEGFTKAIEWARSR